MDVFCEKKMKRKSAPKPEDPTRWAVEESWIPAEVPEGKAAYYERLRKDLAEKKEALAKAEEERKARQEALKERTLAREAEMKAKAEEEQKLKEEALAKGGFYKPAEPKVILVVRIKGINKLHPRVRKIFQLFRLYQINNAVFVKVNKSTMNMIKHIEPFIAYGYPDMDTVRLLLYKQGYLRDGMMAARAVRHRIQNNDQIHDKLGKYGVEGIEDMAHEIYTAGPNFREVTNALWTFKLRNPTGGLVCKRHGFAEFRKGDWGNREHLINELVQRML